MRFAVFASGNGGNLQAIIKAVKLKKIKATLALVFSDKPDAFALERARKAKIPTVQLSPKDFATRGEYDRAIVSVLKEYKIQWVVLAGYMRLLSGDFIDAYPNRIINIHPSLLPAFKGAYAIRDAFEYPAKVTGVTIHYVVEEMDAGKIIAQEPVRIDPKDTLEKLANKIHKVEHQLYPKTIATLIK